MKEKCNKFGKEMQKTSLMCGAALGLLSMFPLMILTVPMTGNGTGIGAGFGLVGLGMIVTSPAWGPFWIVGKGIELATRTKEPSE